jgi:hypothetical protein
VTQYNLQRIAAGHICGMTGEVRQESVRAKHAPELAGDRDGLIPAQPDSEGLQHHDPGSDAPILDKEGHVTADTSPDHHRAGTRRQKRFSWLIIATIFTALLIGLGVGIGAGYAAHRSHDSAAARSNNAVATVTVTATLPTTTISGVTSGTTGLANLVCGNNTTYTTPSYSSSNNEQPTTFTEQCNADYGSGSQTLLNGTTVYVENLQWNVTYSFEHCMNNCASYNAQVGSVMCQAVVFTANLSFAVPLYQGNCWLKSARGRGGVVQGPNFATYAAAYLDL